MIHLQTDRLALRIVVLIALAITPLLAPISVQAEAATSVREGSLGLGTTWETRWFIKDSGRSGPTVLIAGGVHGNEPAGARAAEQIRHWPIQRGKLVVLPQINRLGLAAKTRWSPDHRNDSKRRDINRCFPTSDDAEALTPHAQAIWDFIANQHPDWVFDLHEGFDFHRVNPKSVGSSVIAFEDQADFARTIQQTVNADADTKHPFDLLAKKGPVRGSLARACGEQLGAKSFILETTFKDQPISHRTRQHRKMVSTALQMIGVIDEDCRDRLTSKQTGGVTNVALFDDSGASEAKVLRCLDESSELVVRLVGGRDMRPEVLRQFDVVVFPGGSGSKQGRAIGKERREHVKRFVDGGGGVVGICAGAYLCTSHYDWSLHLMNAAVFNKSVEIPGEGRKSMWYRGPATNVDIEFGDRGTNVLGVVGTQSIRYHNGPILSPGDRDELPEYQAWAYFRSENGIYEPQQETMIGSPAVVAATYGKGRVLAISPHFESTEGHEQVILRAIEYVDN